jgi:hypothetical protein
MWQEVTPLPRLGGLSVRRPNIGCHVQRSVPWIERRKQQRTSGAQQRPDLCVANRVHLSVAGVKYLTIALKAPALISPVVDVGCVLDEVHGKRDLCTISRDEATLPRREKVIEDTRAELVSRLCRPRHEPVHRYPNIAAAIETPVLGAPKLEPAEYLELSHSQKSFELWVHRLGSKLSPTEHTKITIGEHGFGPARKVSSSALVAWVAPKRIGKPPDVLIQTTSCAARQTAHGPR